MFKLRRVDHPFSVALQHQSCNLAFEFPLRELNKEIIARD
jgi:hypothetical protein